jgi:hypothetical protein
MTHTFRSPKRVNCICDPEYQGLRSAAELGKQDVLAGPRALKYMCEGKQCMGHPGIANFVQQRIDDSIGANATSVCSLAVSLSKSRREDEMVYLSGVNASIG